MSARLNYTTITSVPTNGRRTSVKFCRFCPDWATNVDDAAEPPKRIADKPALLDDPAVALLDETGRETQAFSDALEKFKLLNRRRFVSCEETLAIFKALGYRKNE